MAKKKDFSKINTNPIYDTIQEAAEPMPGQVFLDGTEPGGVQFVENVDATTAEMKSLDDAATEMQQETVEINNPEDAPEEILADLAKMKRNKPRAGKIPLYVYVTPANMQYVNTMAALQGITRQDFVNDLFAEAAKNDTIYKAAKELRKQATKGK